MRFSHWLHWNGDRHEPCALYEGDLAPLRHAKHVVVKGATCETWFAVQERWKAIILQLWFSALNPRHLTTH